MYNFKIDYAEGAHPNIIKKLQSSNLEQHNGYGEDPYSLQAKELIKAKLQNVNSAIFFVSGGTQANLLVISFLLRPHEAVISATTGHIHANEAGAIEATGHRIIAIEKADGKLDPQDIEDTLKQFSLRPHVVKPKMVYISNSTELGGLYTKEELTNLSETCKKHALFLFLDGARLAQALSSKKNDLSLADIGRLSDVFYIGGTKNGALLGEVIIFADKTLADEFDYMLKQRGALLAKGRLLGIQFLELFKDDLFFKLAAHANQMAEKIETALRRLGCKFLSESVTNQIFPIVTKKTSQQLAIKYSFFTWKEINENEEAIRLLTSWATDEGAVDQFITDCERIISSNSKTI